jgi:hypothetical protein
LFTYLAGPFAASLTTSNINEWPAVWCLFSIGLCLMIIMTPLRRHLHIVTPYWRIGKLLRRKTNASESNIPVNDSGASNKPMAEFAASETAQTPPQLKF